MTEARITYDESVAYEEGPLLPIEEYHGHPSELIPSELCMVHVISENEIEFCSTVDYPGCRFKYRLEGDENASQMLRRFTAEFKSRRIPILELPNTIVNLNNVTNRKELQDGEEEIIFNSVRDEVPMTIIWSH